MPALLEGPGFASAVRLRMSVLGIVDTSHYAQLVMDDERELRCIASEIAVPETWFFRYSASFEFLLQWLRDRRTRKGGSLMCASLGCATGVEAWSIAACALASGYSAHSIVVHGLDRNPTAIEGALVGTLGRGSLRGDLPAWAAPWITSAGSTVELSDEVRSCVRFRTADVLVDNDFFDSPIDVMFCRNVVIYLDPVARIVLRDRAAQWLASDGVLFLGHADALERADLFETVGAPAAFAVQHKRTSQAKVARVATRTPIAPTAAVRPSRVPPTEKTTGKTTGSPKGIPVSGRIAFAPSTPTISTVDRTPLRTQISALIRVSKLTEARKCVEMLLSQTPADIEWLETLAGILCAENSLVRAHQTYLRVVYLDPRHGSALLALAELSAALGRLDEAERFHGRLKRLHDG